MNKRYLNALVILLIIVVAYLFLDYTNLLDNVASVLFAFVPFILGFFLSWLLRPLGSFINKKLNISIRKANVIAIFIAIIVIVTVVFIIIPLIIIQLISLFDNAPAFLNGLEETINSVLAYFNIDVSTITEFLKSNKDSSIFKDIISYMVQSAKDLLQMILNTTGFVLQIVFAFIISFYFINDIEKFYSKSVAFLTPRHKDTVMACSRDMSHVLFGYLKGLFLVCLVIFIFDAIGCTIIGIPAAILLALLAAMLNVIPYLGPILGGIPIFIVALSVDLQTALLSLVVVFGAQFIEANFLQPKIMSSNTDLHPVTIIVGLTVFSALFGFVGMVIATPTLAMINVILKHSKWDIKI